VHSNLRGEEKDETVQALLRIESPDEPAEIVIHVNMLKEGWDVTNLYTIVPLRAANSRTLVEQSIGRGLRLPYGKRTGVAAVDRLTIVAHDRFQEIIDDANRPDSVIRVGVVIGRDIPTEAPQAVRVLTVLESLIRPAEAGVPSGAPSLFVDPREQAAAAVTLDIIRDYQRLPRSRDLQNPDVQAEITSRVRSRLQPAQGGLPGMPEPVDPARVVAEVTAQYVKRNIDIPRIVLTPAGEVTSGYRDFDLDVRTIRLQPVAKDILVHHLQTNQRERVETAAGGLLFGKFSKCPYLAQRFQSTPEWRFAGILETDPDVIKWVKPATGRFQIFYRGDHPYEPDFVVETATEKLLCEVKAARDMDDAEVLAKSRAAVEWCGHASDHERRHGGKPWRYVLIPHDAVEANRTLAGLTAQFTVK